MGTGSYPAIEVILRREDGQIRHYHQETEAKKSLENKPGNQGY